MQQWLYVVVESATVVVVVEVVVESATVVVVVVDDIKVSLFETSLPPQNEINNIKSNLDMRLIIKLSQSVCLLCVFLAISNIFTNLIEDADSS